MYAPEFEPLMGWSAAGLNGINALLNVAAFRRVIAIVAVCYKGDTRPEGEVDREQRSRAARWR